MNPTLEQVWNELADDLRQFIERRVSDRSAAEDILQDVFLKAASRMDQLKDPAKFQGWLFLIARNAIIDHYRTRKQTVEVPETLTANDDAEPAEAELLRSSFRRMIHSLPGPYREAILLTEFEGLSQIDLAQRLGISVSGAKSRVQRGRHQLKQMLLECCEFEKDRRGRVFDCTPRSPESCPECPPPNQNG
jgi:RNA polymerase sigma-70 factor (ECF subfamily)